MSVPLWRVVDFIRNLEGVFPSVEPLRVPPLKRGVKGDVEIVVKRALTELESIAANRFRVFDTKRFDSKKVPPKVEMGLDT